MKKIKNATTKKIELASRINLYLGITILLSALIWLISNIDKADSIVNIWLPIMMVGTSLVFISSLIKFAYKNKP